MSTMMCYSVPAFVLVQFFVLSANGFLFDISINSSDVRGPFTHFWQSTGFCPPLPHTMAGTFNLSPDMKQNLAYISAVPFDGITQVRIHWLLELVRVTNITNGQPQYDFSVLDEFVELLHENELNFGFELMGNPSQLFNNFENRTQVYWWKDLVAQTAHRYVVRFGIDYVRQWNFETWNEPDCHDFDNLTMTVPGFINYYDACSEGLKSVDESLIFGGPGDACMSAMGTYSSRYADALLNHTVHGFNYFTGEKGVRIDFLSFHFKGGGKGIAILEKELENMQYIQATYQELEHKPYVNNEADPMVGWNRPFEWRADPIYAGLVAKVITQHQHTLKARPDAVIKNYTLLGNDNGFLSYYPFQFSERTLNARFQMNNTIPNYVTFVRKPVYIVMTMLALLGDKQIHVDTSVSNTSDFGALATLHDSVISNSSDSWQVSLLFFGASDPNTTTSIGNLNLKWQIFPPPGIKSLKMMIYMIYNDGANPYRIWNRVYNKTDFPTLEQFAQIRQEEDPAYIMYDVPVKDGPIPVPPLFDVLDPHVVVMHLCAEPETAPEKVTGVRFINVTAGQVLVVWSDRNINSKCILTYDVELSTAGPSGPYTKVNLQNSFVTLFLFETDNEQNVQGFYRVRAVDYWKTGGDYSDPVLYST
uniref:Fibronectin type-III domain-containing protein n=1 Tax=Arion vulgaris TaxID=1028688 RepID=A0A0B7B7Z3_9EUPU